MKTTAKLFYLLIAIFLVGCTSETEAVIPQNDQSKEITDEIQVDSEDSIVLTIEAGLDGPDQWFFAYKEGIDKEEDVPNCSELHVIPFGEGNDVSEEMIGLGANHFELGHPYEQLTTKVKVFYTRDKKVEMTSYDLVDGKPHGTCTINDPDGEPFLSRVYENGELVKSMKAPYGADWTFDQAKGQLNIIDKAIAIERLPVGDLVVKLMPSIHSDASNDNDLYSIMQKESFKKPITVNGERLTGKLLAYFHPKSLESQLYYELNFTDGALDGEVKVNNEWGELELHERFSQGELDTTVYVLDYGDMEGVAKPIIYLYPEHEQLVEVQIDFQGELTHTYPAYMNGWQVTAKPDGTLFDENGQEYYALYWEGDNKKEFTVEEGFVVKGNESAMFLESALDKLGLTRREANEFIVYWLPQLERNPYNLIHFSHAEYSEMAKLKIVPEPETLIRVMMVFEPLEEPLVIDEQDLDQLSKERKGFTVVEWGGSKVQKKRIL